MENDETGARMREVAGRVAGGIIRVGRDRGRGAGVVLGEGRVATNAHNIRGERVTVAFADGRTAVGNLLGIDADGDLAVLEVPTGDAPALPWASTPPELGAPVIAVVTDAAAGTRVTTGRVSATGVAFRSPSGRLVRDAIEHTAPLARGSSGGPLLDTGGQVVGINTHRRDDGFYLAQPAGRALRDRLDLLATGTAARRARLGVAVAPPEVARRLRDAVGLAEQEGLLVRGVERGGPADRAGIRRGDLFVSAAGRALRSSDDLYAVLDDHDPSGPLTLVLVRGTEEQTVTVAFGAEDEEHGEG